MNATSLSEPTWQALYDVASTQEGLFTARQAASAGYSPPLLVHHQKAGRITQVRRGIYRQEYRLTYCDRFLARAVAVLGDALLLKGGLVLELRLERARTTKDIDLRVTGSPEIVLAKLQKAGRKDCQLCGSVRSARLAK